jgi:hypothetical protein
MSSGRCNRANTGGPVIIRPSCPCHPAGGAAATPVAGQLPTGRPQKRAGEAAAALRGALSHGAGGRSIAMVPRARARWAAGPITVDGSLCRAAGLACQARRALAWAGR